VIAASRERCGFEVHRPRDLTPAPSHSATGPPSEPLRSAKELGAYLALAEATPAGSAWAERVRADAALQQVLANKKDRGGDIATRWVSRIRPILAAVTGAQSAEQEQEPGPGVTLRDRSSG
jgi:hypothetical protein